ncbi:MAG: cobalamin B12-binding domain-containing protein [bacterium]|nr:cobalamin B12-binding domain-containing protein [bacterium]
MKKILLAKVGLDGHDRGIKIILRALKEAGFKVIYTGIRQLPRQVAAAAIQEDVDVVAVSILSGAHKLLLPEVAKLIKKQKPNCKIIAGGVIPKKDFEFLKKNGIDEVFETGTPIKTIIEYLNRI